MVWVVSLSTMNLITHSLTPKVLNSGIRSLTGFGIRMGTLAQSVLYLHYSTLEASPKAISGRTRYLRVRLAFHLYPQLIPWLFNASGCGPPLGITRASPWPWVGHPVSGLQPRTLRPIQTRFPCGSRPVALNLALDRNSPARTTKSTRSHLNGATTDCRHTVSGSISLPSRGAFHLSLTVLVRYRSLGSI